MTKIKTKSTTPDCPRCGKPMVLRQGPRGPFYGCSGFPACRGAMNAPVQSTTTDNNGDWKTKAQAKVNAITGGKPSVAPIKKASGSPQQEAVWKELLEGATHLVVEAVAGSGKTWTMVQGCLRIPTTKRVGFVAFNRHIANEATGKLQASGCMHVSCGTYHSFGLRAVRSVYPNIQISEYKIDDIWESIPVPPDMEAADWRNIASLTKKLVAFAKNYLLDETDPDLTTKLEELADHHAIDLNGIGVKALEYVPRVMAESRRRASAVVDFDDMIWLPVVLKLKIPFTFDILIVDEAQDTNRCQQELALLLCPSGRIVIVGDRYQSIYGFRGADVTAIPSMTARLGETPRGVKTMPLSVSWRCPSSHISLAQSIVPQIQAAENAPAGTVLNLLLDKALYSMRPGNLVLCRCNAPLIPVAYALIRRGVKAVIRGRDIGSGLLALVQKLKANASALPQLLVALRAYRWEELERLSRLGEKAAGRVGALNDRCDCIEELVSGCSSIPELEARIESLFADFEQDGAPKQAVVLGTIHRTKGLEAEVVFVLNPELIPHPMAKQEWEQVQESNLAYVAATRCKHGQTPEAGTLVFCGPTPDIYYPSPEEGNDNEEAECE